MEPKLQPSSTALVECSGISKSYLAGESTVTALSGVNLRVFPGELLMLIGPSGCGKTTLLSIIAGILTPSSGTCSVRGQDYAAMSATRLSQFRGQNIGFVFQSFNLIPTLNLVENVSVPLLLLRWPRLGAEQQAATMLRAVGLGDRLRSMPSQLSGGQQQRVAIARALVHSPKLIVCDEPTSSLDQENGEKIMHLFRKVVVDPERALIIVTHDSRIYKYADRIAQMNDGRIVKIDDRVDPVPGVS